MKRGKAKTDDRLRFKLKNFSTHKNRTKNFRSKKNSDSRDIKRENLSEENHFLLTCNIDADDSHQATFSLNNLFIIKSKSEEENRPPRSFKRVFYKRLNMLQN